MIEYNSELLENLKEIPHNPQGPVGENPSEWAIKMGIQHNFNLPNRVMDRKEVRNYCQSNENEILAAYLAVMAWGGQGKGPGGRKHVLNAWNNRNLLLDKINRIKEGNLSREESFNLFVGERSVPGLGPAYFTKLLYFFGSNMYIMDQWTTKPVLLLTEKNIIRHTDYGPSSGNNGENYELFCLIIEDLVNLIEAQSGEEVEERLFSKGSINGQPRGEFRQLIVERWENRERFPRYQHRLVKKILYNNSHIFNKTLQNVR